MQQLQFAAGGGFDSSLHRSVQLLRDIADKGGFGSSKMYNMHFEDDSGVVDIAGVWMGGVQVGTTPRLCNIDLFHLQIQRGGAVSFFECLGSSLGGNPTKRNLPRMTDLYLFNLWLFDGNRTDGGLLADIQALHVR